MKAHWYQSHRKRARTTHQVLSWPFTGLPRLVLVCPVKMEGETRFPFPASLIIIPGRYARPDECSHFSYRPAYNIESS